MGVFYEGLSEELSLYVRQMAWLLAIPRLKDASGKETKQPARIAPYKAQKTDPPLPPLTAVHLYAWLMEVGPTEAGAMGQAPISWATISAWAAMTSRQPAAWEALALRRASTDYLAELHAAEDLHRAAPWTPERAEVDREAELRQLRAVLG